MLLHGGYWLPEYGLDQLDPLAERLTALGLGHRQRGVPPHRRRAAACPATLEDVAAALDLVTTEELPGPVVTLGHSAGGHLAVWAASRTARTPGGAPRGRWPARSRSPACSTSTSPSGRRGSSGPVRALHRRHAPLRGPGVRRGGPGRAGPGLLPGLGGARRGRPGRAARAGHGVRRRGPRRRRHAPSACWCRATTSRIIDPGADSTPTVERLLRRAAG